MNVKSCLFRNLALFVAIIIVFNACATGGAVQNEAETPVDRTAQYEQTIRAYQEQCFIVLRGILKMHNAFRGTTEGADLKLQFDFTDENFSVLRSKYGLETIAGTGSDLSKSLNILSWLCEHTYHVGDYDNHIPWNSLDLLEYAYDTGAEQGINCFSLSLILTECLLSIGIPARTVIIMPFSPYDRDNHVVTHAYIADLDKWIMLDPTYCAYFKDSAGNILDVFELRAFLADGRDVFLNEEFSYNGVQQLITDNETVREYKLYMTKDLCYFETYEISAFGSEHYGRSLYICPVGYNLFESRMYNLENDIEFAKAYEGFDEARESYIEYSTKRLEGMKKSAAENEDAYLYVSLEDFLAKPDLRNK
jgi:hypothetical protein